MLNKLMDFQVVGLLINIIGAFYIARGFIFENYKSLLDRVHGINEAEYPGGVCENLFIGFYKQAKEAWIGFILLFIGFIFQACGLIFSNYNLPCPSGFLIVILAIFLPWAILKYLFRNQRLKFIIEKHNENK